MNYSKAIFIVSDAVRAVSVSYELTPGGVATDVKMYKTMNQDIEIGDFVVIPTQTRHKMTVGRVESVDAELDLDDATEIEWIVDRLDLTNIDDIRRQEAEAIEAIKKAEKRRKRDELRSALQANAGDELKALPIFSGDKSAA